MFQFKQFFIDDSNCAMKVGTDGVLLGAWADVEGAGEILDVGCGSGLIALMMAQRAPFAKVTGVEIDPAASADAVCNVSRSPWGDRVAILNRDIAAFDRPLVSPLLIISNPPFFTEKLHSPEASRSLARHGSEFGVGELIEFAAQRLVNPCDSLAFIAPADRDDELEFLLSLHRLCVRRRMSVCSREGRPPFRTLWQVVREDVKVYFYPEISYLCIRNHDNDFTPEYVNLTSDFYLDK